MRFVRSFHISGDYQMIFFNCLVRNPLFYFGLLARISLILLCTQSAAINLYIPFLEQALFKPSFDPWEARFIEGGSYNDFPYGVVMLLAFAPLFFLGKLFLIEPLYIYFLTLFFAELGILKLLNKISRSSINKVLLFYWLSPIPLLAVYGYGYNDVIPAVFLLWAVYLTKSDYWHTSIGMLFIAISAKISMLVALPIFFIFFVKNPKFHNEIKKILPSLAISFLVFILPFLLSDGAISSIFNNPQFGKLNEFKVPVSDSFVLLFPAFYFLFLHAIWKHNRLNNSMLISLLGIVFLCIALIAPGVPGWFLWSLPFLVIYQTETTKIPALFSISYSVAYAANVLTHNPLLWVDETAISFFNINNFSIYNLPIND